MTEERYSKMPYCCDKFYKLIFNSNSLAFHNKEYSLKVRSERDSGTEFLIIKGCPFCGARNKENNMKRTKNLVEFIRSTNFYDEELFDPDVVDLYKEYRGEIVVRLRAYDKLKESINELLDKMSKT